MNIILTGPKHCGKSTLLEKILKNYKGKVSGFITFFDDRDSLSRRLLIRNVNNSQSTCAVSWNKGAYTIDHEVFDHFAPSLIDTKSDLIVFDELGKFESACSNLQSSVENAFSSPTNVIAVVRLDAPGWINSLKSRNDVIVLNISEENRDLLVDELLELIL